MAKKVVKLVDNRAVGGGMVRELRKTLRAIDSGEIVSMAFVYERRDGTVITRFDCECPLKAIGSVELLRDYIKVKKIKLL